MRDDEWEEFEQKKWQVSVQSHSMKKSNAMDDSKNKKLTTWGTRACHPEGSDRR